MDAWDFTFWLREAKRRELLKRLWFIHDVRLAMHADEKQAQQVFVELKSTIAELEGSREDLAASTWRYIRAKGRG